MKKFLLLIVVSAIVIVVIWTNRDRLGSIVGAGDQTTSPTTVAADVDLGLSPAPEYRGFVIDPSTSTDSSFRTAMKDDLIEAVRDYVPAKPTEPRNGAPAVIGLELTVRLVGTDSLAYGQPNITVSIPSVPPLPARPDMTAPDALGPGGLYAQWQKSETAWSTAYDASLAAGASAVQSLQGLDVDTDELSGITAAAAALTLLEPADGDVAYLVASDLDENRPEQAASFHGHPIVVIQSDPIGDVARWDGLFDAFSAWASDNGAGPVTRVRPELAGPTIRTFITGEK